MTLWAMWLGCGRPDDRYVTFTESYSNGLPTPAEEWSSSDPLSWAPWTCPADRDANWADWPGGQKMWLDAGVAVVGSPLTVSVTGATPGDLIEFRRGNICRLDCPAELRGGCFHPTRSNLLGLAEAGNDGVAFIEIPVAIGWSGAWWVVQARSVDAEVPYVSQPLLAHTEDWTGAFPVQLPFREVSTVSIRGLQHPFEAVWPVPAGQRATIVSTADPKGVSTSFIATRASADVPLSAGVPFLFTEPATVVVRAVPNELTVSTGISYGLDLIYEPDGPVVAWYLDADGDGWGDSAVTPTFSATAVAGRVPNGDDCDDGDPTRAPDWGETCGDGVDQDCDGLDRSCSEAGTRWVGPMRLPPDPAYPNHLRAGDLDGDGATELVVAPIGIASELSHTDGDLAVASLLPAGTWMGPVSAVGDLDGDGQLDLINDRNGSLQVLLGPLSTAEPWDPVVAISQTAWVYAPLAWVEAGDLDGNGKDEVIVPIGTDVYWLPDPLGSPDPQVVLPYQGSAGSTVDVGSASPHIADLDADGIEDLVTGDGCVHLGPFPDPLIDCLKASDSVAAPEVFVVYGSGDADGDGRVDLVTALSTGATYVVSSAPPWVESSVGNAAWLALSSADPVVDVAVSAGAPEGRIAGVSAGDTFRSWMIEPNAGGGSVELDTAARWLIESSGPSTLLAGDLDLDGADDLAIAVTGASWADRPDPGLVWILWAL